MIRDGAKIIVTPTGVSLKEALTKEVVKDCLQDWLEMNCGQEKDLGGYPDWKSAEVE